MLRYLGNAEKLGAVFHFNGHYKCVAVTANYTTDASNTDLELLIETALYKVVLSNPVLCIGIIDEATESPAFVRLDSIDPSSCVEYQYVTASNPDDYNGILETILQRQHSLKWQNLSRQPPWKIIVIRRSTSCSTKTSFDIIFAYHHALADGLSGLIFHQALLYALESGITIDNPERIIKVPDALGLAPPIEKQLDFTLSSRFLLRQYYNYYKAMLPSWARSTCPAWAGNPSSIEQIENYKSRTKLFMIDTDQLALVLSSCREQEATLTGFFHGIILASFARHVPTAQRFLGDSPYSLRHLVDKISGNKMGCYAWGVQLPYSPEMVSKIRSGQTDAQLTDNIWDIARAFSTSMKAELKHLPKDSYIGVLSRVKKLHDGIKAMAGKPRSTTFEVSNLGVFKSETKKKGWAIEKMVFSQSGQGAGIAMSFDVVSVAGGPLTFCATWMEDAIAEGLVDLVCCDILHHMKLVSRNLT